MAPKPDTKSAEPEVKKSPLKTIITLGALLLVEAVVIIGVMLMVGGPEHVAATTDVEPVTHAADDMIREIEVLDAKLANNKTGLTYIYPTEIYVQVKKKHAEQVTAELEQFHNEIKADITTIWRTAEPHHFQEPKLENLNRKVLALLNDRFGADKETQQPIIVKCVIVMGTGFRVDG